MLVAFNYHYVRPDFLRTSGGIQGVTPVEFEAQLDLLARHGEFVSAQDILAAVQCRKELPERSIAITFDDGLHEQYEYAWPLLRRKGIPAIFFLNTRPIAESRVCTVQKVHLLRSELETADFMNLLQKEAANRGVALDRSMPQDAIDAQYPFDSKCAARLKYLLNFGLSLEERETLASACFDQVFPGGEAEISRSLYFSLEEICELTDAGCIGTHAHDHLPLGLLPDVQMEELIRSSIEWLEQWTGQRPFALSYPYGTREAISPLAAALACRHGIEYAFTLEMAGNTYASLADPLFLARFDCNHLPGAKWARWKAGEMFENLTSASWYRT